MGPEPQEVGVGGPMSMAENPVAGDKALVLPI